MSNCQKLWNIWFITYLIVINIYLTVVSIKDYLDFKFQMFDPAYGGNWDTSSIHVILGCLMVSLGLLPIIIYMTLVPQGNLANDGHILGRDPDRFELLVNKHGKLKIVPNINDKSICCKNSTLRLLFMELPPVAYLLHTISAACFLIPKSFIEAQRIQYGVVKSNHIWHSDLDFVFDPDQQHSDFIVGEAKSYMQPMSVAYFNLCLSLILLSLQYSRVMWFISRKFTVIFSFVMVLWAIHVLLEFSSVSVLIKVSVNPQVVSKEIQITMNKFTIQFLSIVGNIISLFSFMTVFHYGLLQYVDAILHKNRKSRRQVLNSSPQMIGSNQLDIHGAFSPSVSENNFSDSSMEPVFSKSHISHILAIACLGTSASFKSANLYLSFVHLYQTTSDILVLVNLLISCLFLIVWLTLWFAFALRRTWSFKIKSDVKIIADPIFLNGNSAPNHSGTIQLHQIHNSLLRNQKSSENTLSKQEMMNMNRNVGLDGCSDDTDMSSKMSSNNYVFLQSMRNGQMNVLDPNGQQPMIRNPLYLSYALNNQGLLNNGNVYANEDSLNNRSVQLEDQLGSEHSYNSNRSRNVGFENMPPNLPNFDENRYRNPNSVAMERLIPRYLRNPTMDYNSLVHLSMPNSEFALPTVTTPTMSYTLDNGLQNYQIGRYKQSVAGNQIRPTDKFSTLQTSSRTAMEPTEFLVQNGDDEMQRRVVYNGDAGAKGGAYDSRRGVKSPLMFSTLEESITDGGAQESECLLPKYNEPTDVSITISPDSHKQSVESNNNESVTAADRMCSQV